MEDLYEVIKKLNGPINPIGETNQDEKRLNNLKCLCKTVDILIKDIHNVAFNNKHRVEYSMKISGEYADSFLKSKLGIK